MNFEEWRHNTRAWLFHFIGNETRAYDEYVIAYRHNPTAEAARSLGAIQAKQDHYPEAAHWFEEAVRPRPGECRNLVQSRFRSRTQRQAAYGRSKPFVKPYA